MKSVLYVGATLMIGASIYGFVDYKKTSHDKEFTKMYEEPKTTEPVTVAVPEKNETVVKQETRVVTKKVATKKAVTKKQAIQEEEAVPSIKPIAEDEKMTVDDKDIEKATVSVITSTKAAEKRVTKPRKFSTKLFSRGALDERYVEPKKKKN